MDYQFQEVEKEIQLIKKIKETQLKILIKLRIPDFRFMRNTTKIPNSRIYLPRTEKKKKLNGRIIHPKTQIE